MVVVEKYNHISFNLANKTAEIGNTRTRKVFPGEGLVQAETNDTEYLFSEGFMCCSGLILINNRFDTLSLAHVEPIDRLHKPLRNQDYDQSDSAIFVYGSRSECAYEIEAVLAAKNVSRSIIKIRTGNHPVSLSLDLRHRLGLISCDYLELEFIA
jgi:hypothetical protein